MKQKQKPQAKPIVETVNTAAADPFAGMSEAQLREALAAQTARADAAEAKAERATKANERDISLKVAGKGGVSLYGLGRFPTTLYLEQWRKIFAGVEAFDAFVADNEELIKTDKAESLRSYWDRMDTLGATHHVKARDKALADGDDID